MSTDLTVSEINLPPTLTPELAAAVEYAKAEKAPSTRKAYGTDFRIFREWCEGKGATSLPAQPEIPCGRS